MGKAERSAFICAVLKVLNRSAFDTANKRWLSHISRIAEVATMNIAQEALENAVEHSPQYSGQFAASWNLSIGTPDFSTYQPTSQTVDGVVIPYQEGSKPAISAALSRNRGALLGFKLGQTAFLSNSVEHDEPYSYLIETNQIQFRDENVSGGRTLSRATEFVARRYAIIGRHHLAQLIGT